MKQPAFYVDNKAFYDALVERRNEIECAKELGLEPPQISEYIGECIKNIAYKFSNHRWFVGYSNAYKDEMISDSILTCIEAVDKFDPDKTQNPFSYFTQVTYFAYQNRLEKERKQERIKGKYIQNIDLDDLFDYDHEVQGLETAISDILTNYTFAEEKPKEVDTEPKRNPKRGTLLFSEEQED